MGKIGNQNKTQQSYMQNSWEMLQKDHKMTLFIQIRLFSVTATSASFWKFLSVISLLSGQIFVGWIIVSLSLFPPSYKSWDKRNKSFLSHLKSLKGLARQDTSSFSKGKQRRIYSSAVFVCLFYISFDSISYISKFLFPMTVIIMYHMTAVCTMLTVWQTENTLVIQGESY